MPKMWSKKRHPCGGVFSLAVSTYSRDRSYRFLPFLLEDFRFFAAFFFFAIVLSSAIAEEIIINVRPSERAEHFSSARADHR